MTLVADVIEVDEGRKLPGTKDNDAEEESTRKFLFPPAELDIFQRFLYRGHESLIKRG